MSRYIDAEHLRQTIPIDEQIDKVTEAILNMSETILEHLIPTVRKFIEMVAPTLNLINEAIKTYPNKRVVYLAIHGKERVRKKNSKRIMKWIERNNRWSIYHR